jgi:hypothetical protein
MTPMQSDGIPYMPPMPTTIVGLGIALVTLLSPNL